jgi:outer membrane receptor protein involved in Fe transport
MVRYLLLFFALTVSGVVAYGQTSLQGKVKDDTGEPVIFGSVALYKNEVLMTGTETDFDGNYAFNELDPGTYDVEVSYVGLNTKRISGVKVFAGKANIVNVEMTSDAVTLGVVDVVDYKVPLVEADNTTQGNTLTSEQIKNLPTRNINALAAQAAGIASADEGDAIAIRGSRSNATDYYVDGIRVRGNLVPESEIEQLQVITGGIEAQYGDVTGGVISITTKGPSRSWSGGVEIESSRLTDPYDQSLIGFNLSGPIVKKKGVDGAPDRSVVGIRLAGRVTDQLDDDPPATDIFQVKPEVLAQLQQNPVIGIDGVDFTAADFLNNQDVNVLDIRPNENFRGYQGTAKIDARLSDAIDITFSGQVNINENTFTPGGWRLMNSQNNPTQFFENYRGNFRFRHRLGRNSQGGEGEGKGSLIQNASYTLQFGYERQDIRLYDPRHEDNLFNYGYIGNFAQEWVPTWETRPQFDDAGNVIDIFAVHTDYTPIFNDFTPNTEINPVLANYNNTFLNDEGVYNLPGTVSGMNAFNGDINNIFSNSWGFHSNVGSVYNLNRTTAQDVYTLQARTAFDLVPGGSDKGRHNIQMGVWYEERINRNYDINPRALWLLARQLANSHIQGIPFGGDDNLPISDTLAIVNVLDVNGDTIFNPFTLEPLMGALQDVEIAPGADARFYQSIRELTGAGLNEFVNVDGINPNDLSLDMFSARELNDFVNRGNPIMDYYGYTYLGEVFDGTFDDFFTAVDADGIRTFPVAPFRPIYSAAFIQDKFTFKDIIFRLGVRVDRYDANTQVLKDPYSLYEIQGAADYHTEFGGEAPGNIGEDFKVYGDESGESVVAYRDGDQWFQPNGNPVNNPSLIFQGGTVNPVYANPNARENENYIKEPGFDTDASFEDYEVQVNVMPRLAFSFPISDEANFFAHYDILVQRPPSNSIATALDYFYFYDRPNLDINNPNLRPERTIDYEVGFQQKLSNSSALKISAYYKEMRDMIQLRTFFPVPVIGQYTTFDNIDFGTTKGFTFVYDLRRTGNLSLNANYTLQFADGTGSNAESQRNVSNRGVLRTLFPLDFDERHRFVLNLDYRYASGNAYTGPRLFGKDILANAGLNLQGTAVSGRPYTATQLPEQFGGSGVVGSLNGARQPWNFVLNLRVDKNFNIGKNMGLNVYCRISNLLDRRNIINVYSATGSPTDDGYIASEIGSRQLENIEGSQRFVNDFLASYQWRLLNPNFFTLPRRIYLGAIFDF